MGSTTRRQFLRQAACAGVGYGAVTSAVLDLFKLNAAAAPLSTSDYRALVCVFLRGGNDANNVVVPMGSAYSMYAAPRGGLAVPTASLLPIAPINPDERAYGLHPALAGMQSLFDSGKLALLFNVGPLVAPLTRQEFLAGSPAVPYSLFSHSEQEVVWQTSVAEGPSQTGWGGRIADLLHSLNGNSRVSMSISAGGANSFQVGRDVFQ